MRVTKQHNDECKQLLSLMGVPYVDAPCEAEAQCAALCAAGKVCDSCGCSIDLPKVYAAASEDMDTLTFKAPVLLRHLTFSEQRKVPIAEVNLETTLLGLSLPYEQVNVNMTFPSPNRDQFVDLCILLGCDYCDPIKGIGPKTALNLIREHKTIEKVLESIDIEKHPLPDPYPFQDARDLFLKAEVSDPELLDIKWKSPDVEG